MILTTSKSAHEKWADRHFVYFIYRPVNDALWRVTEFESQGQMTTVPVHINLFAKIVEQAMHQFSTQFEL
jgi:hypothetical protein